MTEYAVAATAVANAAGAIAQSQMGTELGQGVHETSVIATKSVAKQSEQVTDAAVGVGKEAAMSVVHGEAGKLQGQNVSGMVGEVDKAQIGVAKTGVQTAATLAAAPLTIFQKLATEGRKTWRAITGNSKEGDEFQGGDPTAIPRMNIKITLMILFVIFLIALLVYLPTANSTAYTCVIGTGIAYAVVFIIDRWCEDPFNRITIRQ